MASKLILVLALLSLLILGVVDVQFHGHFNDAAYERKVQRALIASGYNMDADDPIRSPVEDRWVTLTGPVPSEDDPARVAAAVQQRVPGLRGITTNLRTPQDVCEEGVLRALKDYVDSGEDEARISYLVDAGCSVTLTGWVPTEGRKQAVGQMAKASPGVTRVVNNIEIGAPKKKLQDTLIEIMRMENIYFDFNKWTIREESRPALDKIARAMQEQPGFRVRIEGHTDAIASEAYNQTLSEKRAEAVRSALIERGVDPERLEARGFGEVRPIAPNDTPEGRAENRRIEFKVL